MTHSEISKKDNKEVLWTFQPRLGIESGRLRPTSHTCPQEKQELVPGLVPYISGAGNKKPLLEFAPAEMATAAQRDRCSRLQVSIQVLLCLELGPCHVTHRGLRSQGKHHQVPELRL